MLTVRDLIESYGINEAAADLAEISGADCPPQSTLNVPTLPAAKTPSKTPD